LEVYFGLVLKFENVRNFKNVSPSRTTVVMRKHME